MKIGIVCFNLFIAGGARLVFDCAQALKKMGHKVVIFAPAFDAHQYKDIVSGLEIRVVPLRHPPSALGAGRPKNFLHWIVRKFKHEYEFISASKIIAQAIEPDFDALNLQDSAYRVGYYYRKKNPKTKIVWTVNGTPFQYIPRGNKVYDFFGSLYQTLKKATVKRFLSSIDAATVLAFSDTKWFEGFPVKKVVVTRAGVEYEKFYSPVKDFKEKAGKKYIKIFALGALNSFRRYDNIVEAVNYLRQERYDAHALIFANNIWGEDKCKADLIALVKKYHLEPFVEFKFDGASEQELTRAFRESDVFVQAVYVPPPGHHGWGLVNFEAMASGLPVVLCRTSTATEVLRDGQNVLLVEPLSPRQIAQKVKFLIDNPSEYFKIATDGQKVVREQLTWEGYAKGIVKSFES